MYGKPFNPKREFGTIMGDTRFHFEQDGQLYNALKQPVDVNGALMPIPPMAEPATKKEPAPPSPPPEDPSADMTDDDRPFDLLAWANDDPALKATPWAKILAETARIIDDTSSINSKTAARKAILAFYAGQQS
jgi:hypothetical protein